MTIEEKQAAINELKLPPDELDSYWPLFRGFIGIPACIIICLVPIIYKLVVKEPVLLITVIALVYFVIHIVVYVFYFKIDRRLSFLSTGLDKNQNEAIATEALEQLNWKVSHQENKIVGEKKFQFSENRYMLVVLIDDAGIYYNIRTKGNHNRRYVHSFGFESWRAFQFKKKVLFLINEK